MDNEHFPVVDFPHNFEAQRRGINHTKRTATVVTLMPCVPLVLADGSSITVCDRTVEHNRLYASLNHDMLMIRLLSSTLFITLVLSSSTGPSVTSHSWIVLMVEPFPMFISFEMMSLCSCVQHRGKDKLHSGMGIAIERYVIELKMIPARG